ncbi:YgdI/YgdR family lipoprotein [Buttiauxella sp. S19-1]|uniref:YgdI/YgdR family lipoprotein n=1 Tax=Buttiauxella sp. S19-1 TaxID=941430 RepID=UPI001EDC30A9|nr:YgdI/YgdR family lipoprotein [Buttiauxella sp. S19-1]
MQKALFLAPMALLVLMLTGCTTDYTMTTRTVEVIKTQGKPEADQRSGVTHYADAYGYHREIKTSEIVQTVESGKEWGG